MKRSREPEEEPAAHGGELDGPAPPQTGLPPAKITGLDDSAVDDTPDTVMKCSLPPHRETLTFKSYGEYEAHYGKAHTNRCVECRKNFPSEHFVNLHIEECHDAFAAVLREKGEHTYSCLVEGCDRKCRTPQKRRMHLIDKHMYPKNYFFAVTKEGVDGRSSLLLEGGHRRRHSSVSQHGGGGPKAASRRQSLRQVEETSKPTASEPKASSETSSSDSDSPSDSEDEEETAPPKETADTEMEDLAGAMSSLQFVPRSIRFGRGKGKAGFARR